MTQQLIKCSNTYIHSYALVITLALSLALSACTSLQQQTIPQELTTCHVVYDAGSSGTRLYVYQQIDGNWTKHVGPVVEALADPVRGNRGKSMSDAESVSRNIVAALQRMLMDGPVDSKGESEWLAFNWRNQCQLESAAVYATAGMRLAEVQHPIKAKQLWKLLNDELSAAVGLKAVTRTLSGYEEGLYAWLAANEDMKISGQSNTQFGITEMGGASAQITFPCNVCEASKTVTVDGEDKLIFSHSYLGLGQDEAWKKQTNRDACTRSVGMENPNWLVADCTDGIVFSEEFAVDSKLIFKQSENTLWYLTGAFRYTHAADIQNYCRDKVESGFSPATSCFRPIYQSHFLNALGIPIGSALSHSDWTLGALICSLNSCLSKAGPPECEWSVGGCE